MFLVIFLGGAFYTGKTIEKNKQIQLHQELKKEIINADKEIDSLIKELKLKDEEIQRLKSTILIKEQEILLLRSKPND